MLNCKEVSKLASQSLDRQLSFRERMGVKIHLMMCRACSRFLKQIRFLRVASRLLEKHFEEEAPAAALTPEARKRMQDALEGQDS
ncbi:MAG: zf-HC2 domain-containing protein [Planctomycetota bacterium]|jgi:predicted anti-sigma-YlaC factor YlaD